MAEELKHILGEAAIRTLAGEIKRVFPDFRAGPFTKACLAGLADLALMARAWHIADALHAHLPRPFAAAADILLASLGPRPAADAETAQSPLRYMPHLCFVQKYGLDDFEAAMRAQYELTQWFSAEFSIRAYLTKYPEATYARLLDWTRDGNVHIRRLASEGTRPRLPWASRLPAFQADPRPVIALLERLKDDPERYVQRSVANNLNDIGKDHPDLLVELCRQWLAGATPDRQWIVRHALRSLVKKSHLGALSLLGVGTRPDIRIADVTLAPRRVNVGGKLRFSFTLASTGKRPQDLLIDYAVHFVKANGGTRPKVFKLRRIELPPATELPLASTVSFADMTTRKHYPGRHRIDLLVNGIAHPLTEFDVRG
ncbi:MAG: DNA alkylation repair protein [Pseudomonadota bacterium]